MKEKIILFIVTISLGFCAYGQNKYENLSKSQIIATVRSEFLNDTIKKNVESKLVLIDGIHMFKPGLLEPKHILEFLDEVFVESKIKTIQVLDRELAANLFDGEAQYGVVAIRLRKGVNLSLNILGFAMH